MPPSPVNRRAVLLLLAATGAMLAVLLAVLATGGASPVSAATHSRSSSATQLLPDLNPLEPRAPALYQVDGRWLLAFGSAADNLGEGSVMIHGERADVTRKMKVSQLIEMSDGTTRVRKGAGTVEYVYASGHQHFHYLAFMAYELRTAAKYKFIRPGQKTGFCLMDDYDSSGFDPAHDPPNKPPAPVYTQSCQLGNPDALSLDEGISVGYGDYYNPLLEGQSIDVTDVPDGLYYLIIRVNPKKKIKESNYKNNGSSVLIELSHPSGPGGDPAMQVLNVCRDSDHCPLP
jgi:hypothetical protein